MCEDLFLVLFRVVHAPKIHASVLFNRSILCHLLCTGVSNWQIRNLQRMVDLGMEMPAVNQVEAHVGYVEDDLLEFCKKHGIVMQVLIGCFQVASK